VADHIDRLMADIALVHGQPGWKVITCARDVSGELAARTREKPPEFMVTWGGSVVSLLGIAVITVSDYAPGQWRFVKHDRCEFVAGGEGDVIIHDDCTVIDEEPG